MNLKLRLERLCDSRSWARFVFADGTSLTGRVLRVGHDYLELECYGDTDRPGMRNYAKHLIPLNLVKYITIDSTSFGDAERNRLNFISEVEVSPHDSMPEIEK